MKSSNGPLMGKLPEDTGTIFNIKRFSVHDGPGIRTSIFLKGCPMNCVWCHNPEGISSFITIWYNRNICIACGQCVDVCPNRALTMHAPENKLIEIDRNLCKTAGDCVKICPTGALEFTGRIVSVDEIMQEIRKDLLFFRTSGGGVTITGGEPAFQPEFCLGILEACKSENIITAVETCLYCERDVLESLVSHVDLFIVDIKIFDSLKHEQFTGKPNHAIRENFRWLAAAGRDIIVRIPVIRGITDAEENIREIVRFVQNTNPAIPVEFLDFNMLTRSKYQKLSIPFSLE